MLPKVEKKGLYVMECQRRRGEGSKADSTYMEPELQRMSCGGKLFKYRGKESH